MQNCKLLNCEIDFQDLESIEFSQNIHKVLKFQIQPFFIQILFFTTDDRSANVFCIVFH